MLRSLDEPALFERFKREIRIAGALAHPSIVRIYDAGEIDEQPFVAMEYVARRDARQPDQAGGAAGLSIRSSAC